MESLNRIDAALDAALSRASAGAAPPKLSAAMRHAVFPGGARVRPQLCLAVATACGDDRPAMTDAAGAALELMHCASLVHDDMPCFDDAGTRRGKASVHAAFGEPIALLAGDAMIVAAYDCLSHAAPAVPERLGPLVSALCRATGMPGGIVAGQAWESEPAVDLAAYHRAKTGALFVAATRMGALAAGAAPEPWRALGERLGDAYQVADDLRDAVATEEEMGKPCGQDAAHGRPSAVAAWGVGGAVKRLSALLDEAIASIPDCRGRDALAGLVAMQAKRLTPQSLGASAA